MPKDKIKNYGENMIGVLQEFHMILRLKILSVPTSILIVTI